MKINVLFKHFIITRFNLVDKTAYNVSYDYVNSDSYLLERFGLFDTYCYPSISQQSNINFTWLLLFNEQLPEKWKKKVEEYRNKFSNIEIHYISAVIEGEWQVVLNKIIMEELSCGDINPQYLLTTRIDNDDAFHLSFVDSIQNYFLEHIEEALINYVNGLQYITKYNALKNTKQINGHFGTFVEKNNPKVRTVLSFAHNRLPDNLPKVVNLKKEKPIWLEVLHETNVLNAPWFRLNHLLEDLFLIGFRYKNLNEFGIKQDIPRINFNMWKVFIQWVVKQFRRK